MDATSSRRHEIKSSVLAALLQNFSLRTSWDAKYSPARLRPLQSLRPTARVAAIAVGLITRRWTVFSQSHVRCLK